MHRNCFSICQLNGCLLSTTLLFTFALTGCGGEAVDKTPKGNVTGKVTVGGAPFAKGSIHFAPAKGAGNSYGAEMKAEGVFEIAAPIPAGSYKVYLTPPAMGPVAGPDGQMQPPSAADMKNNIPQKYRSAASSDKTVEIKASDNDLTIDLK